MKIATWLEKYTHLTKWHWATIAISGIVVLLFLVWRGRLKKWAKEFPEIPDNQTLSRKVKWRLHFTRITLCYRECSSLMLCIKDKPDCSRVHGSAMTLIHSVCPFTLIRVLIWLRREFDLDSFTFSNHLHLLNLLAMGLEKAINKKSFLWPREFKQEYRKLAMEVYTSVAHNVVRALQMNCYLNWVNERPVRHKTVTYKRFPLGADKLKECQERLRTSSRSFSHESWQAFEKVVDPIEGWLNSNSIPQEIEESLISSAIPRLLSLPLDENLSGSRIYEIAPKLQQFAKNIANTVIKPRTSCERSVWLRRLRNVLTSDILSRLFDWLDMNERQILIRKIFQELVQLVNEGRDEYIPQEQMNNTWEEFDKQIEIISKNRVYFEDDWRREIIDDVDKLSKDVKENQNTKQIVYICDSVKKKFIEMQNQSIEIL